MEAKTILLAQGEILVADRLCKILNEAHYLVDLALDGNMGKQLFNVRNYDLVLVDLMLPGTDGFELCNYIRGRDGAIPLMVLSWGGGQSKLEVLNMGVDDFLVMTQDFRELLLRIKVLTKRCGQPHKRKNRIAAGDIIMDLDTKEVIKDGRSVFLSTKEFLLLKYLVCNKNRIVSRKEIAHTIYTTGVADKMHRVAAFINSLRSKLEEDAVEKNIFTVTGKGYLLAEKVHQTGGHHN